MEDVHLTRASRHPNAVVVLVSPDNVWMEHAIPVIRKLGFEVRATDDVYDAIGIVQFQLEYNPVILLTEYEVDPKLNAIDGVQLIQQVKQRKVFPVASYFVSNYFDDIIFAAAKKDGAEECLTKYLLESKEYNLGEYFKQVILSAKDVLRHRLAEDLDMATSDLDHGFFVYNKVGAEAYFEHTWRKAQQEGMMPSIGAFDLVGFGGANEETHDDGDRLIRKVPQVILASVKSTDYLCRGYGKGDEFFLVMPGTTEAQANKACKRANEKLSQTEFFLSSGKPFPIAFRYGVATVSRVEIGRPSREVFAKYCKEANLRERAKKQHDKSV